MVHRWMILFFVSFCYGGERYISCSMQGGLGNQLFQIANTLAVAWDHGYTPTFAKLSQSASRVSPRPVYWDSIFYQIPTHETYIELDLVPYHEESLFHYKKIEPYADRVQLHGYFCSAKYFDHHREKILDLFQLPPAMKMEVEQTYRQIVAAENENTVSIHIRLDDTFTEPVPGVIDFWREPHDSYYDAAIAQFPGDYTFVVISDNCEWSREYMKTKLKGRRAVYVCGTDYKDLWLMSLCKHNIIVNSTFSWWGAYLNRNPDKIVVSPKYWQAWNNTPYRKDILMDQWILIENVY